MDPVSKFFLGSSSKILFEVNEILNFLCFFEILSYLYTQTFTKIMRSNQLLFSFKKIVKCSKWQWFNGRFAFVFGRSDFHWFLTFFDDLGFLRIDLGFTCDYLNVVATGTWGMDLVVKGLLKDVMWSKNGANICLC